MPRQRDGKSHSQSAPRRRAGREASQSVPRREPHLSPASSAGTRSRPYWPSVIKSIARSIRSAIRSIAVLLRCRVVVIAGEGMRRLGRTGVRARILAWAGREPRLVADATTVDSILLIAAIGVLAGILPGAGRRCRGQPRVHGEARRRRGVRPGFGLPASACARSRSGSRLIFLGTTSAAGRSPGSPDGTAGGTQLLKDINPGPVQQRPRSSSRGTGASCTSPRPIRRTDGNSGAPTGRPGGTQLVGEHRSAAPPDRSRRSSASSRASSS